MSNQIKKGLNLYLYYWVIPLLLVLILINKFYPYYSFGDVNIGLMISVVSFLFGFFITISFSLIMNRVALLKESLAIETGRLASLFLLSKHLGKEFHNRVKNAIDKYTITTLRYYAEYEMGREIIYQINDNLNLMEMKNERQRTIGGSFLYILGEFEPTREKLEYLTKGKLMGAIKITNYTLAFLIIGLLFLNRGNIFTDILFVILSATVFFALLIIEDYQNLKIGDYSANISNSEQIFDLIQTERYYPRYLINRVKLKRGKNYRIGFFNPKTRVEEIVVLEYNPKFWKKMQGLFRRFVKRQGMDENI
ncbi:MAG: hypothetical protein KKF68_01145 [Nanoarchaeota archaeon]|nr:hypothetical protein [Nanoarchaeota archaeon]